MERAQRRRPGGVARRARGAGRACPGCLAAACLECRRTRRSRWRRSRELVDSGQLTDDDKREIKKMFAESLGGGDVDEKIREANKNRDQLDAQAREALDLLNKLMVCRSGFSFTTAGPST